jgi:ribosomal protein L7Ae-like RNA K-turn-binding protein
MLDASGRAPGRGVYVCCDVLCLRKALKSAKLALALKRSVMIPDFDSVYQDVQRLLYTRLSACLSLGQKAGAIVSGYMLLRQAFAQARVLYMIIAEDIAPGRAQEYRSWCTRTDVPCVTLFTKADLGYMIGKPSRSAVGLTAPHFLELLRARLAALERLQTAYTR